MAVDVTYLNANNINNINNNFERTRAALQETLGRSGSSPNHMNADLDMNENDILNVDSLDANTITIGGLPIGQFNGTFKGLWNNSTQYKTNDVVRREDGSLWIAQRGNFNSSPVEGLDWTLFMPLPENVTDGLGKIVFSRTEMSLLSPLIGYGVVSLVEGKRSGTFRWDGSDLSEFVSNDTQQGIFVAPASDPSGASGAWRRTYNGNEIFPEWFGAVGSRTMAEAITKDEYIPLQAALDALTYCNPGGGGKLTLSAPFYGLSQGLVSWVIPSMPAPEPGIGYHLENRAPSTIYSPNRSRLVVISEMTNVILVTFRLASSTAAQAGLIFDNIGIEGRKLAVNGIYIDWAIDCKIVNCAIRDTYAGIRNFGYGGMKILHNLIASENCVLVTDGGDNIINDNGFTPTPLVPGNIACGVTMLGWSGNTTINSNTISREADRGAGEMYGVLIDARYPEPDGVTPGWNFRICDNEFCGMTSGVLALGKEYGRIESIYMHGNHVIPGAGEAYRYTGQLISCQYVRKVTLTGGNLSGAFGIATDIAINCVDCENVLITGFNAKNYEQPFARLHNCTSSAIRHNVLHNIGRLGPTSSVIALTGNTRVVTVADNTAIQDLSSYAQRFVEESGSSTINVIARNHHFNIPVQAVLAPGSTSVVIAGP